MPILADVIKDYLTPGSIPFLLIALTLFVLLLFRRGKTQRWGRIGLVLTLGMYWLLSAPSIATLLEVTLSHSYGPLSDLAGLREVDAVVVLGGGGVTYRSGGMQANVLSDASVLRGLEGARLYHQLNDPWVIASGGTDTRSGRSTPESIPLKQLLLAQGVPAGRILLESASGDTYEQALYLKDLLASHGIQRFILVTSPIHMGRAMATFRAQGLDPIAGAALQRGEGQAAEGFLPSGDALRSSQLVMREILATVYYAVTGRFASP